MSSAEGLGAERASSGPALLQPGGIRMVRGDARRLGAHIDGCDINFALAAPHAEGVELCLYDAQGQTEAARLTLEGCTDGIWHGRLLGWARPGGELPAYGWRVHGPWDPGRGQRFNPAKLLLDPYAREVFGRYAGEEVHLGHDPRAGDTTTRADPRDNAALALKARVVADLPPPPVRPAPLDPAARIIYEMHVKGFTRLHPEVPAALRGTYAGLAHPAALAHLLRLGVTTVSLMPVSVCADESRLLALGLTNYWGYNPVAWSAPDPRYWSGTPGTSARGELRAAVDALHAAGLEVILDVVYNHTGEGDETGPCLSLRGIDNALYYHLLPDAPSRYANWTGCGNCVNLSHPLVLRTVMDSLRRWVLEYGIDGFRFDLAPVLARGGCDQGGAFLRHAPLFAAIGQDPVLNERLMIAEPWDVGPNGYQLGAFPPGWLEWNDRYRDDLRGFWLQGGAGRSRLAYRLAGSSDVFGHARRAAYTSVNFITAHDGFTLADLVSYAERHNEANGEGNRDGHSHNLSVNNGIEGETGNAAVLAARARQRRTLFAALLVSLGTPMLLAGDEIGHSQGGNNNAYCQDNETTWINWSRADLGLLDFVGTLVALRRRLHLLRSSGWWRDGPGGPGTVARWFGPDGAPLSIADWESGEAGPLGLVLLGADDASGDEARDRGEALLLLFNGAALPVTFCIPPGRWLLEIDSEKAQGIDPPELLGRSATVAPGCLWLARAAPGTPDGPAAVDVAAEAGT